MSRTLRVYKSYVFRDKDPVIDEFRTMVEKTYGEANRKALHSIRDGGGPSVAAMAGWLFGKTKRPQNPTMEAAGRSMGFKRVWVKMNGHRKP